VRLVEYTPSRWLPAQQFPRSVGARTLKHSHRPATLKSVARAAGVSYQTVSRAVNGDSGINAETRRRVLQFAQELGYRTNRLAISLRSAQSRAIGLVISDLQNLFYAEVAAGVEAQATDAGYSVILANTGEDIHRERTVVLGLFERRVDGLIIAPAGGDHSYLETELPITFPIVAINRTLPLPRYGAVLSENEIGAQTAVEHLIAQGHRKIGAIVASTELITSRERLVGHRAAMRGAQLPIKPEWVATGPICPQGAREAATAILKLADRPTAILTASPRIAQGVLLALRDLNLSYNRDLELVSFDDFPWAAFLEPPMNVVAQAPCDMGREAVIMLVRMISGEGNASIVRMPTRLINHRE